MNGIGTVECDHCGDVLVNPPKVWDMGGETCCEPCVNYIVNRVINMREIDGHEIEVKKHNRLPAWCRDRDIGIIQAIV